MKKQFYLSLLTLFLSMMSLDVRGQGSPGGLDPTFGTGGKVYTQVRTVTNYINDMVLQPDGKIVAIGSGSGMEVVRYTPSGALDSTFNGSGMAEFTSGEPFGVALQPDGKIVVVGNTIAADIDMKIVRYNVNGTLDTTFDGDGVVTLATGTATDIGFGVVIQSDGKILVSGRRDTPPSFQTSHVVVRLNANGSQDMSFGDAGMIIPQVSATHFPHELALQPDGKFVIVSSSFINGTVSLMVLRYTAGGAPDPMFGVNGVVSTSFSAGVEHEAVAIQPDGKIVVSCSSFTNATSYDFAVLRYNTDGSLDDTFGTGGIVKTPIAAGAALDQAKALVIQPDGKIILGGRSPNGSNYNFAAIRYLRNGTIDTRWGVAGIVRTDMGGPADGIHAMVLQPNGRIVVGGESDIGTPGTRRFALARYFGEPFENADFDRDGSTDLSVFRPSTGEWLISESRSGLLKGVRWGLSGDELATADYDGDQRADIAVWRAGAIGSLYVLNSSDNSVRVESLGQTGDDPSVAGDYDGDGLADPAVFRAGSTPGQQSYFYYRASRSNPNGDITYIPWGTNGDIAVRGDFSGDGRIDPTVFRPSTGTWYTLNPNDGNSVTIRNWGISTDKLVPADYTGDGKTDYAVFRNGVWYILRSDTGTADYISWGLPTDKLVPADYDGDDLADVAVYRDGTWYILGSSVSRTVTFGLSTDVPVPGGYIP